MEMAAKKGDQIVGVLTMGIFHSRDKECACMSVSCALQTMPVFAWRLAGWGEDWFISGTAASSATWLGATEANGRRRRAEEMKEMAWVARSGPSVLDG